MDGANILSIYEGISDLTKQMLAAAQRSDWDGLIALEKDCGTLFARLLSTDDNEARTLEFRQRKAELIRSVLDDDAQIRLLVEPWLVNLAALLGSTRQQRQLNQIYRPRW